MDMADAVIKQHLIDPEICIRCNTCEATCPVGAITHDSRNYVVDADKCNLCMACIPPCPTGSIDNWRTMPRGQRLLGRGAVRVGRAARRAAGRAAGATAGAPTLPSSRTRGAAGRLRCEPGETAFTSADYGATLPPWSAAHAYTNLYGPKSPTTAHGGGQRPRHRGRHANTTRTTSCSTSARCRSRCSKASRSASCRRASTPAAGRTMRASTRSPARATASGPATTTCR